MISDYQSNVIIKKLKEEFQLFKKLVYSKFKMANQADVSNQQIPTNSIQGEKVTHYFENGSSGLFG